MKAERTVILASAGSGKTYRLSAAYLRLIAAGADPRSVLATTFTRKAAGEIARRALGRALEAARHPERAAILNRETGPYDRAPDWSAVAVRLARHIHDIRVQTLDSFFVGVAQGAGFDLGLTPGWAIAHPVEDEVMRSQAVVCAVDEADRAELVELLRMLAAGDHNWSVLGTLRSVLDEASEAYFASGGDLAPWASLGVPEGELANAELTAAIAHVEQMPVPQTKSGADKKLWADARAQIFEAATASDWAGVLTNTLVVRVLEGDEKYAGSAIEPEHAEAVTPVARHASAALVADHHKRTLATYALVRTALDSLDEQKALAGRYTFSDIPRALARLDEAERAVLYESLDVGLDHLLLDEFQDTSAEQYTLLEPLVDEIASDERDARALVCVGDVKQALYLWREAAPEILGGMTARYPGRIEPDELNKSYRTSRTVLDAVNRVFENVASSASCAGPGVAGARRFEESWEEQEPARDLAGHVTLEAHGADDVYRLAAERAGAIVCAASEASVALLVRRRKEIPVALEALRTAGIDASEEGGNPLTDSPAVAAAVSAFICAEHPGDSMAGYHVAASGLAGPLGITDPLSGDERARWSAAVRTRLAEEGAGAVVRSWFESCVSGMGPRDRARFRQFVALVERIEREGTRLSPADLAERVRAEKVESVRPARVRVMTIHASKGLEFDAVVLPDLSRRFTIQRQAVIMRRDDALQPPSAITRYPSEQLRRASTELCEVYESAFSREVYGELCGLYVAMTRARHALHMIIAAPKRPENFGPTCADLLRETLASAEADVPVLYEHGSGSWTAAHGGESESTATLTPIGLHMSPEEDARTGALQRASPSTVAAGRARVDAASLVSLDRAAADAGTLVHDAFECVGWHDETGFDAGAARTLLTERHGASPERIERAVGRVSRALENAGVADRMSRSRYAGAEFAGADRVELWRERAFLARVEAEEGAGPALVSGRFDRVVVGYAGDRVAWAEVIDFKTEADPESNIEEKAEQYAAQLGLYRRALCAMTGVHPDAVRTTLVFVDRPAVYEVGSEG